MNIFVVDRDPVVAAQLLPDRHVTKMILESAQMLSVVFSSHYWDLGTVAKVDGTPFLTKKGAFKNHPCTQWAAKSTNNCAWLIVHALGLCAEFGDRFDKSHGLVDSLLDVKELFEREAKTPISAYNNVVKFARAMPDQWKHDTEIDDVTAYQQYVNSKPWVYYNYLRIPERRPDWITKPQ